jgi:hypothetical protein
VLGSPAGAAFHTTLEGNLHTAAILRAVSPYRTEFYTRLDNTAYANLGINDFYMSFMLIRKIF